MASFPRNDKDEDRYDRIDLSAIAPVLGVDGGAAEPDYLDYNIQGRGLGEKMFCNTGVAYLVGIGLGGGYGLWEGLKAARGKKARLLVNSALNGMGRRGSRVSNAWGVLAVMFTLSEAGLDLGLGLSPGLGAAAAGTPWLTPVLAGGLTGALYTSTRAPKTMALAGALGALGMGASYAAFGGLLL
mmetsp:Transcript_14186/g.20888  ORF Transcript_14186/g.20888 Transcript_14186/m.20888 type:complete len:185 (-) Transcript_14186:31-585(-)|eukprot:CAMPEP_0113936840 /NCGR_PEP_ID=MMETSP1339-20121228/3616_1 /TAXON_ID=94617 /ORGANISM="Fibrocapsa japonica" /LENGTH=184 /DNA_ID=CAMNT_0000939401 /DNA_START=189 /DNA_END=743 /DNA_ORIENTATION=- /assembly_acc=CAM_ASM_000762